jgi:hypothetical protein
MLLGERMTGDKGQKTEGKGQMTEIRIIYDGRQGCCKAGMPGSWKAGLRGRFRDGRIKADLSLPAS